MLSTDCPHPTPARGEVFLDLAKPCFFRPLRPALRRKCACACCSSPRSPLDFTLRSRTRPTREFPGSAGASGARCPASRSVLRCPIPGTGISSLCIFSWWARMATGFQDADRKFRTGARRWTRTVKDGPSPHATDSSKLRSAPCVSSLLRARERNSRGDKEPQQCKRPARSSARCSLRINR